MLRAMNEITLFSGSRMVGEVERHLHSQSDMDQSIDEGAAQPRARILEIGCGAGQTLVKMASVCKGKKKDWKVLGVDYRWGCLCACLPHHPRIYTPPPSKSLGGRRLQAPTPLTPLEPPRPSKPPVPLDPPFLN